MKNIYPEYYSAFCCTASACGHTCCAGWEIDVDKKTAARYKKVGGDMGKRLKSALSGGRQPHFILKADERCPFLNGDNLCDIILELGEESLCGICTDHPRFRTFMSDRTETGLGLCCEEAARLLITLPALPCLAGEGQEKLSDDETAMLCARSAVFRALAAQGSLDARLQAVLSRFGASMPGRSLGDWARVYLGLERMDGAWTELLTAALRDGDRADAALFDREFPEARQGYENLLWYFIYRHFPEALADGDAVSKLRFAAVSYELLHGLDALVWAQTGKFDLAGRIDRARLYSAEVEYSEENMDALFDLLC